VEASSGRCAGGSFDRDITSDKRSCVPTDGIGVAHLLARGTRKVMENMEEIWKGEGSQD
jgi:hypothetical protein